MSNAPNTVGSNNSIIFEKVITLDEALKLPEAASLSSLHPSQVSAQDLRPLMIELLRRNIGIKGANYGDEKNTIVATARPSVDEGDRKVIDN